MKWLTSIAARFLARHGSRKRSETLEQRRARVHAELRQYVQNKRELTTGEGFLP